MLFPFGGKVDHLHAHHADPHRRTRGLYRDEEGGGDYGGGDAGGGDVGGGDYGGADAGGGGDFGAGDYGAADYGGGDAGAAGGAGDYGAADSGAADAGHGGADQGAGDYGSGAGDAGHTDAAGDGAGDYGAGAADAGHTDGAGDGTGATDGHAADAGDYGTGDYGGAGAADFGAHDAGDVGAPPADGHDPGADPTDHVDPTGADPAGPDGHAVDGHAADPAAADHFGADASHLDGHADPAAETHAVTDADVQHALELAAQHGPAISDSDPSLWERIQSGNEPGVEPAFYPADHFNMTQAASTAAGFDQNAANSFAAATRNVDYQNFADPTAHANADAHATPEQAAQTNIDRATANGAALATALDNYAGNQSAQNAQAVVNAVGAANHQMQDSYAHQGMSFDQHAAMDHAGTSPDVNPGAMAQAAAQTAAVMNTVAAEMQARGIDPASFHPPTTSNQWVPSVSQWGSMAQYQMNTGSNWNQQDTRWPAGVNGDMYNAFNSGLRR